MSKEMDVIHGLPEDLGEEKNTAVVQEHTKTDKGSPGQPEEEHSDDSRESDTTYVNGHPVIRDGFDVSKFLISVRDDGDPALTFRSIVLGSVFTALSSVITMLYVFKPTTMQVSTVFLQLLVYCFGAAWAYVTPSPEKFKSKWIRTIFKLMNFGQPFRIKEHVVAALIASSGNNGLNGVEVYIFHVPVRLCVGRSPSPVDRVPSRNGVLEHLATSRIVSESSFRPARQPRAFEKVWMGSFVCGCVGGVPSLHHNVVRGIVSLLSCVDGSIYVDKDHFLNHFWRCLLKRRIGAS
ncbi:hypothetical protein V2G26_002775 [Clonostachys chloroleuca]